MKREFQIFLLSLMYYSRIPVSKNIEFSEEALSKAFRYFPLVGILVGAMGAGCFYLANLILPVYISILLSFSAIMFLSGCMHEDGLADFVDGFGGGRSKESILQIMKDSHIGTYGVIALIMLIAFKLVSLTTIPVTNIPLVIIAAHAVSRIPPVIMVRCSSYAREGDSKAQHTRKGVDTLSLTIAVLFGVLPILFLGYRFAFVYILLSVFLFIAYRFYLHKKIGGFTGDTLGALQQFSELLFYLTFISLPVSWTESFIW